MKKLDAAALIMTLVLAFAVFALSACAQLEDALGASSTTVSISGSVTVPANIPDSGTVWVGIIDFNPDLDEPPPNPVPWASFPGSSVQAGTYTAGQLATFPYNFVDVPKGWYFLAAIVDSHNSNGRLDWTGEGYMLEPLALYPDQGNMSPYQMKFEKNEVIPAMTMQSPTVTVTGTIQFDGTVSTSGTILVGVLDWRGWEEENAPMPDYLEIIDYPGSTENLGPYTAGTAPSLDFTLKVPRGPRFWVGVVVDEDGNGKVNMQVGSNGGPIPVEAVGFIPDPENNYETPTLQQFLQNTNVGTITVMDASTFDNPE